MLDLTKYPKYLLEPLEVDSVNPTLVRKQRANKDGSKDYVADTGEWNLSVAKEESYARLFADAPLLLAQVEELRAENAEWKESHEKHDCRATVDVGGEIEKLQVENEQLKALLAIMDGSLNRASVNIRTRTEERDSLRAKLERAVKMLKNLEWVSLGCYEESEWPIKPTCPCCERERQDEHEKNCELATLLAELAPPEWSDPLNTGEGIPQVRVISDLDTEGKDGTI